MGKVVWIKLGILCFYFVFFHFFYFLHVDREEGQFKTRCLEQFCRRANETLPGLYSNEHIALLGESHYTGTELTSVDIVKAYLGTHICSCQYDEKEYTLCIFSDNGYEVGVVMKETLLKERLDPEKDRGVAFLKTVIPILHQLGYDYTAVKPVIYMVPQEN